MLDNNLVLSIMGLTSSKEVTEAVVMFRNLKDDACNKGGINGTVVFQQKKDHVRIIIDLKGLKKNHKHGFHIHVNGDLREDCKSCCSHYNPHNTKHGGLHDENSHAGDLGNIQSDSHGYCKMTISTDKFRLSEIVGRSLIVHDDEDDLGKGNEKDSLTTGHSGARIACSIIGIVDEKCK